MHIKRGKYLEGMHHPPRFTVLRAFPTIIRKITILVDDSGCLDFLAAAPKLDIKLHRIDYRALQIVFRIYVLQTDAGGLFLDRSYYLQRFLAVMPPMGSIVTFGNTLRTGL